MPATTTLLGLVTPTQGTLSGTWGDTVNYGISDYVDIAIAGTLSFAGDGAITLANTTGSASGNGITSTTAQYMVIRITGTQTVTKVITGPSYSKLYMVDHAGATSAVTFKAAGQTGVSIAVGEKAFVYYNGTDYVKVASSIADGVTTIDFGSTGLTPNTATSGAVTVAGTLAIANGGTGTTSTTFANLTTNVTGTLPVANGGTGITSLGAGIATFLGTPSSANLAAALTDETGSGSAVFATSPTLVTPNLGTPTTLVLSSATGLPLTTGVTGTLPIANGGTNLSTTPTNGQLLIGNGTNYTLATLTQGSGISITNASGAITIANTASVAAATPTALGTVYGKTNNATAFETFLGYQAGNANTGANNTFVGYNTAASRTAGDNNVAIGGSSLSYGNGGSNVAVGRSALSSASGTTYSNHVAVGYEASLSATSANSNTAVGTAALYTATTGGTNAALGYYSGGLLTTGTQNTFLGYQAGTSGTNDLTTGSNNTIIGYNAAASAAAASNEITFGNASITKLRVPGLSVDWDADAVPFRNIPQNSQSAAYTLVLADAGKHIFHPVGDNNARTFTIPANSSVAYPIGTAITFINMAVANVTIAITTDTMYLSSAGTTGSRTLAQFGSATAIKITSTNWLISGSGLT